MFRYMMIAALSAALSGSAAAQTVDDVIELHGAGLSEATILAQIQAMGTTYALDKDELIKLKKAGVPETLIQAMIRGAGGAQSVAVTTAAPAGDAIDQQASEIGRELDTYAGWGPWYATSRYPASWSWYGGAPYLGIYSYGYPYGYGYHGLGVYRLGYYGHRHYRYRGHFGHRHYGFSPGIIYRGSKFSFAFGTHHRHGGYGFKGFYRR